jgi:protein-ribulosamine 3-kinase
VVRLPEAVRSAVESVASSLAGTVARIGDVRAVSGGCISPAARVQLETGTTFFLKWGDAGSSRMLEEEARSLSAMRATGCVRVPEVMGVGTNESAAWLLLEWLEPGAATSVTWAGLGAGLACMHRSTAAAYGWEYANFIGSLPQKNDWNSEWPAFWRDRRLEPQLELAYRAGYFTPAERKRFDMLIAQLDTLLCVSDPPSLLHGDLWNGNVHVLQNGTPALVDPSCYYGHREVDLAMAELFGGFGGAFYKAYADAWPLDDDYDRVRRWIYQLYYVLVHVNLFGGSYVQSATGLIAKTGLA